MVAPLGRMPSCSYCHTTDSWFFNSNRLPKLPKKHPNYHLFSAIYYAWLVIIRLNFAITGFYWDEKVEANYFIRYKK